MHIRGITNHSLIFTEVHKVCGITSLKDIQGIEALRLCPKWWTWHSFAGFVATMCCFAQPALMWTLQMTITWQSMWHYSTKVRIQWRTLRTEDGISDLVIRQWDILAHTMYIHLCLQSDVRFYNFSSAFHNIHCFKAALQKCVILMFKIP